MNTLWIKCMCGQNRLLVNKYKSLGYIVKVTSKKREWRDEAATYATKLPFAVSDGKVEKL
jgi:hypothetical protein